MGRKTRFYKMGLSVSLASALAVGASAAVAQPASATSREGAAQQVSVEDVLWWVHESGWNMNLREESGYPAMATGFLTTVGVRSEADIPYLGRPSDFADDDYKDMSPSNLYGEGENLRPANYDTAPVQYQITDMIFVKVCNDQKVNGFTAVLL